MKLFMFKVYLFIIIAHHSQGSLNSWNPSDKKISSINQLKLNEKQTERIQQLHYGWYIQAVNGLLGSVGRRMYMKMNRLERRAFVSCLDRIEKEFDIKSGAKCLVMAFDKQLVNSFPTSTYDEKFDFVDKNNDKFNLTPLKIQPIKKNHHRKRRRNKRVKRNILSLFSNKEAEILAKNDEFQYKRVTITKLKSLKEKKVKSPVHRVVDLIRSGLNQTTELRSFGATIKRVKQLQSIVDETRNVKRYKRRMLDIVIGEDHPLKKNKSVSDRLRDLMPDGSVDNRVYQLVDVVSRNSELINANLLSPRFLPILPDRYRTKKLLSPNMFPLYKDDSYNDSDILPIPKMLEMAGMNAEDRTTLIELLMDVSGVNKVVDDALQIIEKLKTNGVDKDIFDVTNLIDNTYDKLKESLTSEQELEMKNSHYSFMNHKQLKMLYGEDGVYNTTLTPIPFNIDEIGQMQKSEKEESLKLTIRQLAKGEEGRRQKRQTTVTILNGWYRIVYLNPTVLSPQAFAPTVNQLSVLGPLVLSPQAFCPSILSPLLMSLPLISPQVGNPLIFSPYVLGPNVLSAAVFNAYVFSPYVLSPNVINPYVLSPLILSPFVLCPDVLSPTILSGVILSPSVLSPSVYTDSAMAANVLSPTFLS